MSIIGTHKEVCEYDGAYKCLKCLKSWGALPGNPKLPEKCKLGQKEKRIQELEKEIRVLQSELAWEYEK